ncbi:hypothetical protein ACFLZC_01780 [Patescibacteria group bacterium]
MKNVKYISAFSLVMFLGLYFVVSAQGIQKNTSEAGNNGNQEQAQTETKTQNQGEEQQLMVKTSTEYKAQNIDELKEAVQAKKGELEGQLEEGENYETHKNQNVVRTAVHAMLASEELTDGIGSQVSEIAKGFNNSIQATAQAEEKIRTRSTIRKIFFGGDKEVAGELEQETTRNQNRIEELNQLVNQCEECPEEVKNVLQEQIQLVTQEQEFG